MTPEEILKEIQRVDWKWSACVEIREERDDCILIVKHLPDRKVACKYDPKIPISRMIKNMKAMI